MQEKRRKCYEDFVLSIEKMGGKVMVPFSEYKSNKTKIKCKCPNGHDAFIRPVNIYVGQGMCYECSSRNPSNSEKKFLKLVEEMGGKVLGKYVRHDEKVKCICSEGHICYPNPYNVNSGGNMCKRCSGVSQEYLKERFYEEVDKEGGAVLGEYINGQILVKCRCKYGHNILILPSGLVEKERLCKICIRKVQFINELKFIKNIKDLGGKIIGKFIYPSNGVECICANGHKCLPRQIDLAQGSGMCPKCKTSLGEKMVGNILIENGINFQTQVRQRLIPKLFFDFELIYNNIIVYIEFDGSQHQEFSDFFHRNVDNFNKSRQRDLLKNFVCRQLDNVRLIRLDHRWMETKKKRDELESYLLNALNSKEKIVADPEMYTWIDDLPKQKTIDKYVVNPEDFPLPRRKAIVTIKKISSPSSETPKKVIRSKKTIKSTEDLTDEIIETKTTKYKTTKIYDNPPREVVTVRKKKVKIVIAKVSSSSEE